MSAKTCDALEPSALQSSRLLHTCHPASCTQASVTRPEAQILEAGGLGTDMPLNMPSICCLVTYDSNLEGLRPGPLSACEAQAWPEGIHAALQALQLGKRLGRGGM